MLDRGSFLLLSGGFVRAAESDDPRAHPILAEVFIGVFPEEERAEAGALKTLTALVERMTPEERESARARLAVGEARARDAAERAEYARGYYLLGAHEESLRVSGELIRDDPKNLDALRLSAAASFRSDDFEAAARDARAVLDADPDDKDAKVIWMFTKDRARASRVGVPEDPFAGKKAAGGSPSGGSGNVTTVATAVKTGLMDNLPIPPSPLDGVPADATTGRVAVSAFTAAATGVGGLLLFMGIGGRQLEEKFPNIRRNMGVGVGVGGALVFGVAQLIPIAGGVVVNPVAGEYVRKAVKAVESPQGLSSGREVVRLAGGSGLPQSVAVAREAAVRNLNTAISAGERIRGMLAPGGRLIGRDGSSTRVRILTGKTPQDAEQLFSKLAQDARVLPHPRGFAFGKFVQHPDGSVIGLRYVSKSGPPTIDVNVPGFRGIKEIKFLP